MNKSYRQGQILNLIRRKPVHTQEQLARELAAVDVKATQVTLSRDIRELGLVKASAGYREVTGSDVGPDMATVAAEMLRDVRVAENIVVLHTSAGNANPLALALDREQWPEIVGTLAGDDTVLVVAPDARTAGRVQQKLREML